MWAYSLSGLAIPWKMVNVKCDVLAMNGMGAALLIAD